MSTISSIAPKVKDDNDPYETAIRENTKAAVDSSTGITDGKASEIARAKDMTEKRLLDAADETRRRGAPALAAIQTKTDAPQVDPNKEIFSLQKLDPYLKA